MENTWSYYHRSLLVALFILSTYCLQCVTPRPLEEGQPTTTPATGSSGNSERCVVFLQGRIERCLERYQQILVTYQAESTTQEERRRLRARFCHQYQVTLQCLHESLAQCPPRPEHLNLIQSRLGYLRGFMSATCSPGRPEDLTPQPTTPTTITTTPLPTTTTTTTKQPSTTVFRRRKTTTRPSVRPQYRDFENNSLKGGYTINAQALDSAATGRWGTTTAVAPPGVKATSQSPTKFQLLFGYHGTNTAVSPSVIASNKVQMERSNVDKSGRVRIISLDATLKEDSVQEGKQVSEKLDCTVDENNRIDVRCIFSGSQRLQNSWTYVALTLITTYMTCWR